MSLAKFEVVIIGGGLAGLVAALILQKEGREVLVLEAKDYPRHKVCGEFISREIVPLFDELDLWPTEYTLPQITQLQLSVASGKYLTLPLSHGAVGWSRKEMDWHLAEVFKARGGQIHTNSTVRNLYLENEDFILETNRSIKIKTSLAIAAIGRRSSLDKHLGIKQKERSQWMGWKMHFQKDDFPNDEVHLHNFPGGYAGLSRVENGKVNMAALLDSRLLKGEGNSWQEVKKLLSQNTHLNSFLNSSEELIDRPVAVSQLDYSPRPKVAKGVLLIGDTAGMIHPLSGNGMAMAIGSAQIASACAVPFLNGELSREEMEAVYQEKWKQQYQRRLRVSRMLRATFAASGKSEIALRTALAMPFLTRWLEKQTHGKAPAL